ncbi:hypothetical protein [Amycolatopsis alkalitolerans]|nr:hypothetical protein [Amycolatopsis alkalitolerans]
MVDDEELDEFAWLKREQLAGREDRDQATPESVAARCRRRVPG